MERETDMDSDNNLQLLKMGRNKHEKTKRGRRSWWRKYEYDNCYRSDNRLIFPRVKWLTMILIIIFIYKSPKNKRERSTETEREGDWGKAQYLWYDYTLLEQEGERGSKNLLIPSMKMMWMWMRHRLRLRLLCFSHMFHSKCALKPPHSNTYTQTHTHWYTGTVVIKEEAALRSFLAWNYRKFENEDINININIGFPFEKFEQRLRLRKGKVAPRRCPFLGFSSFTFAPTQCETERQRKGDRETY